MISVCMIAKDEEACIEKSLAALAGYNVEIIVVDTGSKDKTKEIAKKFTDKVYDYTWENDFSKARNFSINKASNDLVLVIDCDEVLVDCDLDLIEKEAERKGKAVGKIKQCNIYMRDGMEYYQENYISRLFSKSEFCYKGMIHEQVTAITEETESRYNTPIAVMHYGYDGDLETRKKKTKRNISMLLKMHEEEPTDSYVLYQLGKSYYMQEDYSESVGYFDKALCLDLDEKLEYVQDLVESYGYALLKTEQNEKAMDLLGVYEYFCKSSDFIFLIALILMNNGRFEDAIGQFELAASMKNEKVQGINSYLSYYNIGVIYECLGNVEAAKQYYRYCGDFEPAKNRL